MATGQTLATLSAILKEYYLPPVVEQLNNEVLLLSKLEARSQELVGSKAYLPAHKTRSGGIGARAELGTLPVAGNQAYDRLAYDLKYLYGVIQVSGPSMAKTANDAGAFLRSLTSEIDGIRNDLRKDVSRQVYGDGTGVIGTQTGAIAGQVSTLTNDEAIRKGQFYVGQVLDGLTSDFATAHATAVVVSAVTLATPSITLTGTVSSMATTDVWVRAGSRTVGGANLEIDGGLQALVSATPTTGTVGGINVATAGNEWFRNQQVSLATFTLDNLQKAWGTVRVAGGETSLMIGSFGVQRTYYGLLQSQVRFNDPMTLKSGFQTLDFMGKPMVADVDAPFGKLYFLQEEFIKVFSDRDWHFLDEDGLTLKWVSNQDAWQSILARYINLGISRRNVQLVGTSITDTTGV